MLEGLIKYTVDSLRNERFAVVGRNNNGNIRLEG
jgi:hypothetical protein